MRYTAAYLLAVLGGNASPDVAAIAKMLGSVGIECNEERAQKVIDACKGRDVNEIIANGMTKIDVALTNTPVGNTVVPNIPEKVPVSRSRSPSPSGSSNGSRPESPAFVSSCFSFSYSFSFCLFFIGRLIRLTRNYHISITPKINKNCILSFYVFFCCT